MNLIVETNRLRIREFAFGDADFIIELLNSPGWIKYIGDRNVKTKEDAMAYLQNGPMKSYAEHGFGLYRVDLKFENKPIGMCGLLKRDTLDFPDMGFAFLHGYEGKGYAMEGSSAILKFSREQLNVSTLLAITLPENFKSIRLLSALGFVYVKNIKVPGDEKMLQLYCNEEGQKLKASKQVLTA